MGSRDRERHRGAAISFFNASEFDRALVRGPTEEAVFVFADGKAVTRPEWKWQRGGPMLCERQCVECDEDHHLVDVITGDHLEDPNHEAAKRGVLVWLLCKHCDAWVEYEYGDGIDEAIADSIEDES